MNIAVVGLGGVGGYLCASLAKTEHKVIGFARGEHLREIQKNGLEIVEDSMSWNVKVDARELDDFSSNFDVVLFCVKSYDLKDAYEKISSNIDFKTTILTNEIINNS